MSEHSAEMRSREEVLTEYNIERDEEDGCLILPQHRDTILNALADRIRELEAEKASLLQGRDRERIVSPGAPMRSREQINTNDYRNAPSGVGPLADTWRDKPHRLVYDLCAEIEHCRAAIDHAMPPEVYRG